MATGFLDVIDSYFTCEFTTIGRSGSPQTCPVTFRLLTDGRFFIATSIGLPQKAFNIRRNPKVSLLFSDPTGSGVAQPSTVLVQGDAVCGDRIVSDVATSPDLAALAETLSARQSAGAFMSSWLGRRLFWPYNKAYPSDTAETPEPLTTVAA